MLQSRCTFAPITTTPRLRSVQQIRAVAQVSKLAKQTAAVNSLRRRLCKVIRSTRLLHPSRAQRLGLAVHGTNPVTADVVDQLLLVRTLVGTC